MAISLEDRPLSVADLLTTQVVGLMSLGRPTRADFKRRPLGPAP